MDSIYFFFNVLLYYAICSWVAEMSYSDLDTVQTTDECVEGAWYEMQMAAQLEDISLQQDTPDEPEKQEAEPQS